MSKINRSREFQLDKVGADSYEIDDLIRTFSVSSENPYERDGIDEVLLHGPDNIIFDRLEAGCPLLFNHSNDSLIGRIQRFWVESKRLYVAVKFSRNKDAQGKLMDFDDDILHAVSIGYIVEDSELTPDRNTELVTKWQPYEVSLVSIPADISVGKGRSLVVDKPQESTENQKEETKEDFTKPKEIEPQSEAEPEATASESGENDEFDKVKYEKKDADNAIERVKTLQIVTEKIEQKEKKMNAIPDIEDRLKSSVRFLGSRKNDTGSFFCAKATGLNT